MLASLTVATLLNLANKGDWFGHHFAAWEIFLWNVGLSAAVWLTVQSAVLRDAAARKDFAAQVSFG